MAAHDEIASSARLSEHSIVCIVRWRPKAGGTYPNMSANTMSIDRAYLQQLKTALGMPSSRFFHRFVFFNRFVPWRVP